MKRLEGACVTARKKGSQPVVSENTQYALAGAGDEVLFVFALKDRPPPHYIPRKLAQVDKTRIRTFANLPAAVRPQHLHSKNSLFLLKPIVDTP